MANAKATFTSVKKYLSGVRYPISKNELVERMRKDDADSAAIDAVEKIEEDRFESSHDVQQALMRAESDEMEDGGDQ